MISAMAQDHNKNKNKMSGCSPLTSLIRTIVTTVVEERFDLNHLSIKLPSPSEAVNRPFPDYVVAIIL